MRSRPIIHKAIRVLKKKSKSYLMAPAPHFACSAELTSIGRIIHLSRYDLLKCDLCVFFFLLHIIKRGSFDCFKRKQIFINYSGLFGTGGDLQGLSYSVLEVGSYITMCQPFINSVLASKSAALANIHQFLTLTLQSVDNGRVHCLTEKHCV